MTLGILLAAGSGRRMGVPKALLQWEGMLLVDRGVALLRAGGCDPVIVVLGAAEAQVRARGDLAGVDVVVAHDWGQGMGTSLAVGLAAAASSASTEAVVALVDQPFIGAEAVRRLIASGAEVAVAEYDGKPRNPVLISRAHWADIAAAVEGTDEGARAWMRDHPDLVTAVDCSDTGSPADLDTPADVKALRPT